MNPPSFRPTPEKDPWPLPPSLDGGGVQGIAPLASGANNDIVLFRFPDREVIAKRTRPSGRNRLKTEAEILRALGGCHAPVLIEPKSRTDDEIECLWMEKVPGRHLAVLEAGQAHQLGVALRAVHERDTGPLRGRLEAPTWQGYVDQRLLPQLEACRGIAPGGMHADLESLLDAIRSFGSEFDTRASRQPRCLVHTDLIPLNVLFDGRRCVFIDWELGRLDDPEWDLVSIEKSFVFGDGARAAFEQAYGHKPQPERWRLCSVLHYANVALWRLCSFYVRGENRDKAAEFLAELSLEIDWIRHHLP